MRRILSILFLFFFSISIGQNINIVSFDSSAEYNPGSGVSVHFNPSGVFDFVNISDLQDSNNNSFVLELSGPDGDFSNPTVLNTAHDFYTSLINGILPNDLVSKGLSIELAGWALALIGLFNIVGALIAAWLGNKVLKKNYLAYIYLARSLKDQN